MAILRNSPITSKIGTTVSSSIGISYPIKRGNSGYFSQTYDTLSQVKANLICFFNTRRGERIMQPKLGSGLQELLFEQTITDDAINSLIKEEIAVYFPELSIVSVNITRDTDNYKVNISITFQIVNSNLTETISIYL